MELVAILLLSLMGLVASCPPPFNDFKYLNTTLLGELREQYLYNKTIARRWVNAVTHPYTPLKPWPADDDGITRIKYCYRSKEEKEHLKPWFDKGWEIWHKKIGDANAENGHSLATPVEYTKDGTPLYCNEPLHTWYVKQWHKVPMTPYFRHSIVSFHSRCRTSFYILSLQSLSD